MTSHDVADLVAQRAGELVEPLGLLDEAAIDVNEAAGQRERVDLVRVDDVEMPREVGDRLVFAAIAWPSCWT